MKVSTFDEFMAVVDWQELAIGEKQALYEAAHGKINEEGFPFKVMPSSTSNNVVILEYIPGKVTIALSEAAVAYFPKWLEQNYMEGEDGYSYLACLEANEKDD